MLCSREINKSELFTVVVIGNRHLKPLMCLKAPSQKLITQNDFKYALCFTIVLREEFDLQCIFF